MAISIRILDVNDNAPRFGSFKPVFLQAGDSKRIVTQVHVVFNFDSRWHDRQSKHYVNFILNFKFVSSRFKPKTKIGPTMDDSSMPLWMYQTTVETNLPLTHKLGSSTPLEL